MFIPITGGQKEGLPLRRGAGPLQREARGFGAYRNLSVSCSLAEGAAAMEGKAQAVTTRTKLHQHMLRNAEQRNATQRNATPCDAM